MLSVVDDLFTDAELRTLAGFLGGYSGLTRDAYALDLRQFAQWCHDRRTGLFAVTRSDIEAFARHLEQLGRARATISRRLCTITSLYRYAVEEGLLDRSPAVHVRRPRLDYESNATGLDRNEVGAMLVAAGLAGAGDHALISLLALNGLRVSEAIGADIDQLGLERGHRTLVIHRKGGKTVTIPLAPRTARAVDLSRSGNDAKDRSSLTAPGDASIGTAQPESWDASRVAPGSTSESDRTRSGTRSSPRHSMLVFRCATSKKPRVTPTHAPPCVTTALVSRLTGMPPTSCRRSSPERPANQKLSPPPSTERARRALRSACVGQRSGRARSPTGIVGLVMA
jgi:integrase